MSKMVPMDLFCDPMFLVSTISALTLVFLMKILVGKATEKERRYHPIGGTVFNQLMNFKRLHHYMTDLAGKHRTYRLLSPFRNEIYTADPANVEYILKTNFDNYGKDIAQNLDYFESFVQGYEIRNILKDLVGDGIFAVDHEKWRQQRKVSSYEFSTKVLRDFSSVAFRRHGAKLAQVISEAASSNQTMDIQDLFMKSSLDSISEIALGVDIDSKCASEEEGSKFRRAFDDASAMTLFRCFDIFWKIKKFLNIGSEAALKRSIKVVDEFVYKLIRSQTEEMKSSQAYSSMKKDNILSRFLQLKDMETDPKYVRDIILSFMFAGKDTTGSALSWFIYMLCKHPDIQEKVAREVREAIDWNEVAKYAEFAAGITEEALEKMQYLHAAITETLRIYPPVPVDSKLCFSDDMLPDGFSVRKGDIVAYLPYAMGRMRFIWGDDAEEFRPERWLDENGLFRPESPFKFSAFQAGPRTCLGKEFAYRQMKIFTAILCGRFSFKLSEEKKAVNYRTMITLHIDGGLHVQAYHRPAATQILQA